VQAFGKTAQCIEKALHSQPQRLSLALQSLPFVPWRPHMTDFSGLPLVIESSDLLAPRCPHLILVDLTSSRPLRRRAYPGRAFVDPKRTQLGQPPPRPAAEQGRPGKTVRRAGPPPDAVYVVYDDEGGGWAGRFIWLLDVIGHRNTTTSTAACWPGWQTSCPPRCLPRGGPVPHPARRPTATREYLQSRLGAADLGSGTRAAR
jgi:thiosulfate/3-mercaptopyruvate sulfurtransferase